MKKDVTQFIPDIEHFGNNMTMNDTGSSGFTDWQKYLCSICSDVAWAGVYTNNIDNGSDEWLKKGTELSSNTYYIELGDRFYHSNHEDHFSDDIDELLFNAQLSEAHIAIIFSSGAYVSSFAYDVSFPYMVDNPDALIMGHIMDNQIRRPDKKLWYSLHPQFFVINLNLYKKLGCPAFNSSNITELVGIERSTENVHDNYTPLYIKHDGTFKDKEVDLKMQFGSNIINESLKAGYRIINVPTSIRRHKKFYYYKEWEESKNNSNIHGTMLHNNRLLVSNIHRGWKLTYIFNTEKHATPALTDESSDGINFNTSHYKGFEDILQEHPVDSFAIVSSGFVGQWYMHKFGYKGEKSLIFDINATSVHFKKYTLEYWKGPKYQSYADFLFNLAQSSNEALYYLLQVFPQNHNLWRDQINQMWKEEISNWESIDEFQDHWNCLRRNAETAIIDLAFNPKAGEIISSHRGNSNYQFLFISNIFDNRILKWQLDYNYQKIYNVYKNFYDSLDNKTIIIGTGIRRFYNLANDKPKSIWASTTIKP